VHGTFKAVPAANTAAARASEEEEGRMLGLPPSRLRVGFDQPVWVAVRQLEYEGRLVRVTVCDRPSSLSPPLPQVGVCCSLVSRRRLVPLMHRMYRTNRDPECAAGQTAWADALWRPG
jgi:hypothetical protein